MKIASLFEVKGDHSLEIVDCDVFEPETGILDPFTLVIEYNVVSAAGSERHPYGDTFATEDFGAELEIVRMYNKEAVTYRADDNASTVIHVYPAGTDAKLLPGWRPSLLKWLNQQVESDYES